MEVEILDEQFGLYPQKAVFWKSQGTLLLSDLHLGKINHFRKAGIPVPAKANDHNVEVLIDLIELCKPERIICLGDLFHSHYNAEWEVFGEVVKHFSSVTFELVQGNHDIMSKYQYTRKGIKVYDSLLIGKFLLTHHPLESVPAGIYNISGHIHPGVCLKGKGRQTITLPCFYFSENQAFLPAFGKFTGLAKIAPAKSDKVFIVAEDKVLRC
ncbi:MAG TPA: ligase-associated DNA damage response endonuclease PdeM [Chryseosolibacter sp.]